jgi:hypothetical protein
MRPAASFSHNFRFDPVSLTRIIARYFFRMSVLYNSTKNMETMRQKQVKIAGLALIIAVCTMVNVGAAATNTIPAGGSVYLGEEGLDISAAVGANTKIAWFPSTAQSSSLNPEKVIDIGSATLSFYVNPVDFASRNGNWYRWPSTDGTLATAIVAFMVSDPYLTLRIEDTTVNVDVTGKWAPRGDELRFRIEHNLGEMARRGVAGAPVTIKVQTPDGGIYSALINKTGATNVLDEINVVSSPYVTVPFWDTGNNAYAPGTYTIWAECNANNMMNNYNQEGKTYSVKSNLLVQDQNPLITAKTAATTQTTQVTSQPTTKAPTVVTTMKTLVPAPPLTSQATIQETETPTPSLTLTPTPTAAGLCGWGTIFAGIMAGVMYVFRRR